MAHSEDHMFAMRLQQEELARQTEADRQAEQDAALAMRLQRGESAAQQVAPHVQRAVSSEADDARLAAQIQREELRQAEAVQMAQRNARPAEHVDAANDRKIARELQREEVRAVHGRRNDVDEVAQRLARGPMCKLMLGFLSCVGFFALVTTLATGGYYLFIETPSIDTDGSFGEGTCQITSALVLRESSTTAPGGESTDSATPYLTICISESSVAVCDSVRKQRGAEYTGTDRTERAQADLEGYEPGSVHPCWYLEVEDGEVRFEDPYATPTRLVAIIAGTAAMILLIVPCFVWMEDHCNQKHLFRTMQQREQQRRALGVDDDDSDSDDDDPERGAEGRRR